MSLDPRFDSPYDLRFSTLGFPTRVHWTFWLGAIFLGMKLPPKLIPIWVAVVFVAILIHELGHALAIRRYGWYPMILLYSFGGLAIYNPTHNDPKKSLLISLAGPAAGVSLGLFVILVLRAVHIQIDLGFGGPYGIFWGPPLGITNEYLFFTIFFLLEVTFFWTIINLLPIYPLDGGQALRQILILARVRDPIDISLKVSIVASIAAGIYAYHLNREDYFMLMMFGYMAYQNFVSLQTHSGRGGGYGRW